MSAKPLLIKRIKKGAGTSAEKVHRVPFEKMNCSKCNYLNKAQKKEACGCYLYGCQIHGWTQVWINRDYQLDKIGCEKGDKQQEGCQMNLFDFIGGQS